MSVRTGDPALDDDPRKLPPRWSSMLASYLLLAASAAIHYATQRADARTVGALLVATAGWMVLFARLHPPARPRPVLVAGYFAGLLALLTALDAIDPVFGLFGAAVYNQTFVLLTGRWLFGVFTLNAICQTLASSGWPGRPAPVGNWLVVSILIPMLFAGWFIGRESDQRRRTNERLAEALAENAGLHSQLLTQAREAGVQDERQRMAREIHDTLAQGLTGIITQLDAAVGPQEEVADRIGTARALAADSLTEARRSVSALPPAQLDGTRLPDALRELAQRWSSASGVSAEVRTDGAPATLVPDVEIALFRVAQEALANVAKHARARSVVLTLSYVDDVVSMDVRDDGIGFVPDPTATGAGMGTMRQRVRRVAGRLEIESAPGAGTTVNATVPAVEELA